MNMKRSGLIFTGIVLIICVALVTGSTFSIFTSGDKVNIGVTSANVQVDAFIDSDTLTLYSKGVEQPKLVGDVQKFENGGTATFNSNAQLDFADITPGDSAIFEINVTNSSTVDIKYCVTWTVTEDAPIENFYATVDGVDIVNGSSAWTLWTPAEEDTKVLTIEIGLPLDADNDSQNGDVTIEFAIDAVQANSAPANATVVTTPEEFAEAIANAEPGTIIDGTGVVITSDNGKYSLPEGLTYKNLVFDGIDELVVNSGDGVELYNITNNSEDVAVFDNCTFYQGGDQMLLASDAGSAGMEFNNCEFYGRIAPNCVEDLTISYTFNNCYFTVLEGGWPANAGYVNCMGGTHTFNGCTFDYTGGSMMGSNQFTKWCAVNAYGQNSSNPNPPHTLGTTVILNQCTLINCGTQTGPNSTLTVNP